MIKNGDFVLHTGELTNQSLGSWFKYQRQEARCFKEANWLRQESLSRYTTTKANLIKNKQKLFKEKDVSKWEVKEEKLRKAQDTINDQEAAYKIMLPKETKKVEYLAEESAYFTNQVWKEARRVIMLDYAMGREHFVDMGEQMHRHIYEVNLAWGQMLDFYTDLNNARKEKDDNYAEENHIGEEVIEPDDKIVNLYDNTFIFKKNDPQIQEGTEEILGGELKDNIEEEKEPDVTQLIGEKITIKASQAVVEM